MDQPRSFLLGAGNKAPLFYSHVHGRSGSRAISNSQCRRRTTSSALFSECKPTPRGWCFSRHSKGAEAAGKGSCFLLKSPPNNCSSNPASPILLFPLADPNLSQQEAQRRCRPSPPLPRLPTVAARICPRRRPLPPPGRGPSSCLPLSYRPLRAASLSPRGGGYRSSPLPPVLLQHLFSIARRRGGWCFSRHSNGGRSGCCRRWLVLAFTRQFLKAYRHCRSSSDAAQSSPPGKSSQAPGQTGMQSISVTDGWMVRG
jgi:hypothetical protein